MNWGKSIVVAFAVFITLIATMVTISMRKDVNLVSKDYYVQEIAYQAHIDKQENGKYRGNMELTHEEASQRLSMKLNSSKAAHIRGEVYFFRPSDSALDKKFPIGLDAAGTQYIPLEEMQQGLWKVKVSWNDGNEDYFMEKTVILP